MGGESIHEEDLPRRYGGHVAGGTIAREERADTRQTEAEVHRQVLP
jgi:hypothetical protein